jgi:hypothetical protein
VESIERKPTGIVKSQYACLSFDSEGRLLMERDENDFRLATEALEPVITGREKQVVDARHRFARKRYARQYRWERSPEIERAIRRATFGHNEIGKS